MGSKSSVDVIITCPACKSELKVTVHKERLGDPAPPPEYEITAEVALEKNLFPLAKIGKGKDHEVKVEKKAAKAAKKKAKK